LSIVFVFSESNVLLLHGIVFLTLKGHCSLCVLCRLYTKICERNTPGRFLVRLCPGLCQSVQFALCLVYIQIYGDVYDIMASMHDYSGPICGNTELPDSPL